jgi:hypothetical protein
VVKQGLSKTNSSRPRRDVAHARVRHAHAPRRLSVRVVVPSRGCVPIEERPSPGSTPHDALNPTRHVPPRRHVVPAPCARQTTGPSVAPAVRALAEAAMPRPHLRGHAIVIMVEPPLFKVPAFLLAPTPPLHHARHGRRLASHSPARPLGHHMREHLPRDPLHLPRSHIA